MLVCDISVLKNPLAICTPQTAQTKFSTPIPEQRCSHDARLRRVSVILFPPAFPQPDVPVVIFGLRDARRHGVERILLCMPMRCPTPNN